MAIHGNLCIVGAPHEDKAGSGTSGSRVGAAYIFNVSTGATEHTLLNPDLDNDAENDLKHTLRRSAGTRPRCRQMHASRSKGVAAKKKKRAIRVQHE